MEKILELKQLLTEKVEEQKGLVTEAEEEDRGLNEEEEKKFDKLDGEINKLEGRIDKLEKIKEREKKEVLNVEVKANVLDKEWENLGEQLVAIARAADPMQETDPRLLESRAASGMNESVPSEGGFLVKKDFIGDLIERTYKTSVLLEKCAKLPVGKNANGISMNTIDESSRKDGSRWGGIQVYRAHESDAYTKSKPKLGKIEMKLEKMIGLCYVTDENMQDASQLEGIIKQGFSEEFGFKWDDEIIRGTGAGECLGILNSDALISVSEESEQSADTIVAENVIKMWSRRWARSSQNYLWLINQDIEPQLYTMSIEGGTSSVPVYMPAGGLSGSPYGKLFNRPVMPIEQCDTLGNEGDIILFDPTQYLTIDKGGLKQASSIHVRFLYGENTFRFTWRNNGQPIWNSALTPYKGTNTQSPYITLAERA